MALSAEEMNRRYPVADFIEDMSAMAEALAANPSLRISEWIDQRFQQTTPDIANARDREIWLLNANDYFLQQRAALNQSGGIVLGEKMSLVPQEVYAALYVLVLNQPGTRHLIDCAAHDFLALVKRQGDAWEK